jgi:hypothetical protein
MLHVNRKVGIGMICFLVAALLGGLIWGNARRPTYPSQTLPDGSVVRITDVFYGRSYRVPEVKLWRELAVKFLPDALNRKLGVRTRQITNATDTVFIVIETYRTNGTLSAFPRAMATSFSTRLKLSDDIGNIFERVDGRMQSLRGTNTLVEVFTAPLVSQAATQLTLELTQADHSSGWGPAATIRTLNFAILNPKSKRAPQSKPGPLPMTNQIENLTVVLSSVPAYISGSLGSPYGWPAPKSFPGLSILENGRPSTAWSVIGPYVLDDAGNSFGGPGQLSAAEPRKIRFTLNRNTPTSSNDVVVLRNLPFPVRPNDAAELPLPRRSQQVTVTTNYGGSVITINYGWGGIDYSVNPTPQNQSRRLTVDYIFSDRSRASSLTHFGSSEFAGANMSFGPGGSRELNSKPVEFFDVKFEFTTNLMVDFIAYPGSSVTNEALAE